MLGKMMSVDMSRLGGEDEMVNALVSAATLRAWPRVARVAAARRALSLGGARQTTHLDMTGAIVGDSGVGKTCLMLRF